MRSRAALAGIAVLAAAVVALALAAATDERGLAFTLGVEPLRPGVTLDPGHEVCQREIAVAERFDSVRLLLGTYSAPGPRLALRITGPRGRLLAAGALPDGYADNRYAAVRLDRAVPADLLASVCVRNAGTRRVALYVGRPVDDRSFATQDRAYVPVDVLMEFSRSQPRSALRSVPAIFRRAALFHPRPFGAWTFWVLLVLLLTAVPALLAAAMRGAERDDPGAPETARPPHA
jgi:hypothetical protein